MKKYIVLVGIILVAFTFFSREQNPLDIQKEESFTFNEYDSLILSVLIEDSLLCINETPVNTPLFLSLNSFKEECLDYDLMEELQKYSLTNKNEVKEYEQLLELFPLTDSIFYKNQMKNDSVITLDSVFMKNNEVLFCQNEKKYDTRYVFWKPILNKDYSSAIIYIDLDCQLLCGRGWIVILKKVNQKWIKVGQISRWIS